MNPFTAFYQAARGTLQFSQSERIDIPLPRAGLQFTEGESSSTDNLNAILQEVSGATTRSRWITYASQVAELEKRYNARSDFGNHLTKTCIDYRSAWIGGNGADFYVEGAEEKEFLERYVKYNYLDSNFFHEIVTEGEIEGKGLLAQSIDRDKKTNQVDVCVTHMSWIQHKYTVVTKGDDYEEIEAITVGSEKKELLPADKGLEFAVYVKLGGSRRYINDTPPRLAYILWNMDSLDRALNDLRMINHKFGAAFPYWETSGDQALAHASALARTILGEAVGSTKWKIGHGLVGPARFYYGEPSGAGAEMIQREIIRHATIVSSASGVPIHFLGYVELMSNRATAQELMEQVNATTSKERKTWAQKLEELAKKAFLLYNQETGKTLNPDSIQVQIPPVSMAQIEMLMNVYFPLNTAGKISDESLLERIPDIDPKEEQKRLKKENEKAMVDAVNQMKAMGAPAPGEEPTDEPAPSNRPVPAMNGAAK